MTVPYTHDESAWPVVVACPVGESTDGDVEEYVRRHDALVARGEAHVVVMDSRQGKLMRPEHRKRLAAWIASHAAELRKCRMGLAFVSNSALVRGMLTATYWLSPPPYPYRTFSSLDEAMAWARSLLGPTEVQGGSRP
jgi:hypothetical protein